MFIRFLSNSCLIIISRLGIKFMYDIDMYICSRYFTENI